MRVLGVDPGTWRTGAGMIEVQGNRYRLVYETVITLKANLILEKRLLRIYQALCELIQEYRPEVLALENVFFAKDVSAMVKIGEARACAMLAAADRGIPVCEYPPARVKQAVSGNGRATKEQIQHMIKTLLGLKELPQSDSADALAVALCHIHQSQASGWKKNFQDSKDIEQLSKRKKVSLRF